MSEAKNDESDLSALLCGGLMRLRKHIPNMVSGVELDHWDCQSASDMLNLDWVKRWSKEMDGLPFFRYSQSKHGEEYLLMGEWKKDSEHSWWVIGYISEDAGLPEFKTT